MLDTYRPHADQPELIRSRRNPTWFCSVCCAEEGEEHQDYCHGTGIVTAPSQQTAGAR